MAKKTAAPGGTAAVGMGWGGLFPHVAPDVDVSGLLLVEQGELSLVSVVDSLSSNRESQYGVGKDHVVSYSLGGDISLFHIRLLPRCPPPPLKGGVGLVIYFMWVMTVLAKDEA